MFRRTNYFLLLISVILAIIYITGLGLMEKAKRYQKLNKISATRDGMKIMKQKDKRINMNPDEIKRLKAEARLKTRRKNMIESCAYHNRNISIPMDVAFVTYPSLKATLFFSDKYKLLLCEIPKCASTNQAKFLTMAEGLMTKEESLKLPSIRATTIAHRKLSARQAKNIYEITKRMEIYTSMIIVREPFSRLLSAFRNKLENNTRADGYSRLANRMHQAYSNKNNTKSNYASNTSVSFDDFVRYLTDSNHRTVSDPHWKYYEGLCAPCAIKYKYIVHLDTLQEDMDFIIRKMNIKDTYFPPSYDSFTDWEKVKKYFRKLSPETANALYHTYKIDYDLFGFPTPPQF